MKNAGFSKRNKTSELQLTETHATWSPKLPYSESLYTLIFYIRADDSTNKSMWKYLEKGLCDELKCKYFSLFTLIFINFRG